MRILLVGDYARDPRLGSAKVFFKLQEEFRALGHQCDLVLSDDIGDRPHNAHLRRAWSPASAFAAVRRAMRASGPYDVVDAASAEALWIAAARRVGGWNGAAVIARSNGLEHLDYQRMLDDAGEGLLHKPWTRRLLYPAVRLSQVAAAARAADRLLLLNEGDRAFAVEHGWKRPDAIDLVPHGISSAFIDNAPDPDAPRGNGLLFCGSWAAVKGVSYLAAAFSDVIASGVPARLSIVGGGVPADEIRSAFAEAAQPFLTIRDRVPEADVMAAYRSHDLLVAPSTYEGFGMVVIEAMSQRLPVIATPVGCARSFVVDNRTGLVVPPRDTAALAAAIRRALADAGLRRRLGDSGFDVVRQMTWRRTAEATLAVYEAARLARNRHA